MVGAFADGLKANESGLESLGKLKNEDKLLRCLMASIIGFRKWAEYREIWRDI